MLVLSVAAAATVELAREVFPVHEKVSVQLVVTVGPEGLDPGDVLTVDEPIFHGMRWAKWGYLQTDSTRCSPLSEDTDRASAGLVRARAEGLELEVRHSVDGPGIHQEGQVQVEVLTGTLNEGDTLLVELGVQEGDCGWQTSDRALDRIPLVVELNGAAVGSPELRFAARAELSERWVVLPSQAQVGQTVVLHTVDVDRYGNALEVSRQPVSFDVPGIHRMDGSNAIRVTLDPPAESVYWGDLHTHHGHSYYADDQSWFDANHAYSRDAMAYDFGCESAKAYPTELHYDDLWDRMQRSCATWTDQGYVALLGFEWMGGGAQGHHNVYYPSCDGELAPQALSDVDELLDWMPEGTVAIPHAPAYTGFNWETRDSELRPLVEVYSEWGSSMNPSDPGSVPEALVRGQKLGFIASSDNHDGWLGNRLASKNAAGGLAAIRAPSLSGPALVAAMRARQTYATTGARILLELSMKPLGRDTVVSWEAYGTDLVREVHLVSSTVAGQAGVVLQTWYPGTLDATGQATIPWGPADLAVWLEVGQTDRQQAWSSPLYIEREDIEPKGCSSLPISAGALLLAAIGLVRWRS